MITLQQRMPFPRGIVHLAVVLNASITVAAFIATLEVCALMYIATDVLLQTVSLRIGLLFSLVESEVSTDLTLITLTITLMAAPTIFTSIAKQGAAVKERLLAAYQAS